MTIEQGLKVATLGAVSRQRDLSDRASGALTLVGILVCWSVVLGISDLWDDPEVFAPPSWTTIALWFSWPLCLVCGFLSAVRRQWLLMLAAWATCLSPLLINHAR